MQQPLNLSIGELGMCHGLYAPLVLSIRLDCKRAGVSRFAAGERVAHSQFGQPTQASFAWVGISHTNYNPHIPFGK